VIYIHVGRGKSGSSTIQGMVLENRERLVAEGFHCPPATNRFANHSDLAAALAGRGDQQLVANLREWMKRDKLFLSSEFFFALKPTSWRTVLNMTEGRPIKLIAYVRDYPSWLVSLYGQGVKKGRNGLEFDAFLESRDGTVSAIPNFLAMAEVFGWDNIRVRPLFRSALTGGDLIVDLWSALGLEGTAPTVAARNTAEPWWEIELQRAVTAALPDGGDLKLSRIDRRRMLRLFDECLVGLPPIPRTSYLTSEQWRLLLEWFNSDMAILGALSGQSFPRFEGDVRQQPFKPCLEAIPTEALRRFRSRIEKARFAVPIIETIGRAVG